MLSNYHAHTRWCRHGEGEIEEIITKAIRCGYKEFAITEHVPYPNVFERRMFMDELDDFFNELEYVKNKYKDQIKVLKGLECEYFPEFHEHYVSLKEKYELDFLCLGQHFKDFSMTKDFFSNYTDQDIKDYEEALIKGIDSNLFDLIVHPDLYLNIYPFTEQSKQTAHNILKKCETLNIAVEINANGLRNNRGYPSKDFWKLSNNYNLKTVINSDSHYLKDLDDVALKKTYAFAQALNINISEFLEFRH